MFAPETRPWGARLRQLVSRPRFLVIAAAVVVLALAYTLAGFFLVPRLIASYVPRYAHEQLKRRAEIGEVRVNPLLFKLEIKDFRLQEANGRPLLGFDRLFVDFQLSSLFRWTWTFAEFQLEGPRVDLILTADGRLNLAELADTFPPDEPPERAEPASPRRMLLQHAVVSRGVVSFTDLSGSSPQTATLDPINVELHDITTVPERPGPYTITATVAGGGVVGWDGEVSLVPLSSTGRLELRGFPLATAWRFVQDDIALAEPAGRLDADFTYQFAYRDRTMTLRIDGLDVSVAGLSLTARGERTPLLTLERIRLAGGRGDVARRELAVSEISLGGGRLAATMARDGTVNWQRLGTRPAAPAAAGGAGPAPSADHSPPWRLSVEKVRLEQLALSFVDQSRVAPLGVDVGDLTIDLSARLEGGTAGFAGTVDDLGVALTRVAVHEADAAKTRVVSLDRIAVDGGRIDLAGRHLAVSRVGVTGGLTTVVRAADGSLPLVAMLTAADRTVTVPPLTAAPAAATTAATTARPFTIAVDRVEIADHRITVSDRSVTPAVDMEIGGLGVSVRDVRSDGRKPFPFDAAFRVKQGGSFTARGQVAPDGRAASATLNLARLNLIPFQPYVATTAAVVVRSGDASTSGRLTYRSRRDGAVTITYTGSADLDRVIVVEAATGEPLLAWSTLHTASMRFGLAPNRLEIDEVRLAGLDGRLVVARDKTINMATVMKPTAAQAEPPPPSRPAAEAPGAAAAAFPITVERVRIDDSSMSFADLSLVLPFATRVHTLDGMVVGLASDTASRATVKLDGQVDEFGFVKVDGALSSFHPKAFTDIAVTFRNVPMSTLSPYSATFAGRQIRAGTMDLDLEYKIDQSVLVGENKVLLRQLQLGERVESPGAMRLPLDLAIAILSDAQGRIDIELPVRGNVDHPEFSYGHLIWQALVNLIRRIVTSPFRALGGLFGADAEKLQTIAFEAGSDTVLPPERQKLSRVAEVLDKRPQLKLTIHGGYEPKVDGEAMRALRVRQAVARKLDVALKPGEDPGPVAFDNARTQRALEALLTERGGDKALEQFQTEYEKRTGKKAERVNPVLAFVGRGSADRAFYEALFRRLVETAPLADAEMVALAQRRGEAVARVLKAAAAAAAPRVEVGAIDAADRAERDAVPTRLELGAVGAP